MVQPYSHSGFPKPGPATPTPGGVAKLNTGSGLPPAFNKTNLLGGGLAARIGSAFSGAFRKG